MSDRCRCFSIFSRDSWCSVHGDVDAILASGVYADRRGERWIRLDYGVGCYEWQTETAHYAEPIAHGITPDQMRQKIVRDLHRAECPGLAQCEPHPFPMIWRAAKGRWWHGTGWAVNEYPTFAEAIAAAHNMTGDTK